MCVCVRVCERERVREREREKERESEREMYLLIRRPESNLHSGLPRERLFIERIRRYTLNPASASLDPTLCTLHPAPQERKSLLDV